MWRIFQFCCGNKDKQEGKRSSRNILPVAKKKKSTPTPDDQQQTPQVDANKLTHPHSEKEGEVKLVKQDRYEGQQLQGVPHGNGSMLYANGDFYRGEWVNGKKEGRGLQIYQDEGVQYDGEWQNDQPHGKGKMLYPNQSKYEGEFKRGIKDGQGKYFDAGEKKEYEEQYESGKRIVHKEVEVHPSREQDFPTLALDKERFNTDDLAQFEERNPDIQELDMFFLMKYYGFSHLTKLDFIVKNVKEWTIKEVIDFLEAVGLKCYKEAFYKNKVKGKDMITLSQKELKDDLNMKMGDRKRFMNFMVFLSENEMTHSQKALKKKRRNEVSRKNSLKFGSTKSMRRVLDNFNSRPIYEESIKEERECSSSSSEKKVKVKRQNKTDKELEDPQESREYDSVADLYSPRNRRKSSEERYSLQEKIQTESSRSEKSNNGKRPQTHRKNSKQVKQDHTSGNHVNNHYQQMVKKDSNKKMDYSEKIGMVQNEYNKKDLTNDRQKTPKKSNSSSSSSSSSGTPKELTRKKTEARSHQNTEIRELYQFLKDHKTLQFLIKEKDIEKLELIGQGGYGKVYKGKYIGQEIAIKDYMKTGKHRHKEDFMKEVMIISDLKHPNIVLYMGICITADKFILVTEYLENGSLFDQLHKKLKKFTEVEKIEIAYEIVKGMVYLHNMKNLLHRDLKSSNVLIGEDWNVVKLCDFGLSGQKKKHTKHKRVGTYQWMAPEVVRNEKQIDEKSDVYSFGVIMWELLTEKIPYEGLTENQIVGLVGYDNDHHLQEPDDSCIFLKRIMNKCLKRQSQDRPTFMELQSQFEFYLELDQLSS